MLLTLDTLDTLDTLAHFQIKWMAHGGNNYASFGVGVGWYDEGYVDRFGQGSMTTHHSFAGSVVIADDTWYYTTITITPDQQVTALTSTGNYADMGGSLFYEVTYTIAPEYWAHMSNAGLYAQFNDNYAGTAAWMTLGEASDITLPVELSSFTATPVADGVQLKWRTESEVNNLGFDIYKSDQKDGKYTKVNARRIKGAGTDATPHDYSFTDENAVVGKTYYYYIEDIDYSGETNKSYILEVTVGKQSIRTSLIPRKFALLQNYPNPFNPETWIPFQLAEEADVLINIYSLSGKLVKRLHLGQRGAGFYMTKEKSAYWDGRNEFGERVSSGVYFYQFRAGDFTATRRMVIVK